MVLQEVCTFELIVRSYFIPYRSAFSEMSPVLHIVGVPSTVQQKERPMLHHTLGDGRYDAYYTASKQFTTYQARLWNRSEAATQIDEALRTCITRVRLDYVSSSTSRPDICTRHVRSI